MVTYNVGDIVTVRSGLIPLHKYGDLVLLSGMNYYAGHKCIVVAIDNEGKTVRLNNGYSYTYEMIMHFDTRKTLEIW